MSEDKAEFWYARDLAPLLDYQDWRNFVQVVDKAKIACERSFHTIADHFGEATKMVVVGSGAKRAISDYKLSRYACYLIVQNGDPSKPVIANGQTNFALQTRRQELQDSNKAFAGMSEDQRRLMLRDELTHHNKALSAAARQAGVETTLDYAVFQNHGYKGLYGGLDAKDIHTHKGLKKSQKSWITWEAPSSLPICFEQHRPKRNSAEMRCPASARRTKLISMLEAKCARQSANWAERCPSRCRHRKSASNNSNGKETS